MKKKENNTPLIVLLVISISLAVVFGRMSYSMDHRLDIPVIDNVMGNNSSSVTAKGASGTSSKKTSSGMPGMGGMGGSQRSSNRSSGSYRRAGQ